MFYILRLPYHTTFANLGSNNDIIPVWCDAFPEMLSLQPSYQDIKLCLEFQGRTCQITQLFICHSLYWCHCHCLIIHGFVCSVVSELLLKSCNQPAGLYMYRQEFTGNDKKISLEVQVGHGVVRQENEREDQGQWLDQH